MRNRLSRVFLVTLLVIVTGLVIFSGSMAVAADEPPLEPAAYYGEVTIDGDPAPEGTAITAEIDGDERGSITVSEDGEYGGPGLTDEKLQVDGTEADEGEPVEFLVNGEPATADPAVTWAAADSQQVDLSAEDVDTGGSVTASLSDEAVDPGETATVAFAIDSDEATDISGYDVTISYDASVVEFAGASGVDMDEPTVSEDGGSVTLFLASDSATETPLTAAQLEFEAVGEGETSLAFADGSEVAGPGGQVYDTQFSDGSVTTGDAPASETFEITDFDSDDSVTAGEDIVADATIENTGDASGTQDVVFAVDGETEGTASVTLDAGESTTETFSYTTDDGDVPEVTVSASTDDDSAERTVSVEADDPPEDAFFDVAIDADAEVMEGEDITVDATIENTGEESGTQEIVFAVDGETAGTTDVTLDGGESTVETFTYTTDSDDVPEVTVSVSSDDDSDSQQVSVVVDDPPEEAFFSVALDADESVTAGEDITVSATIENTGEESDTQDIVFEVDGGVEATESISLDGGESTTETFVYTTTENDTPEVTVSVSSGDDSDSQTVTVEEEPDEAFFSVVLDADESVTAGEQLTAEATIENTGDESGTQDIVFEVDGTVAATESISLDGGESTTAVFTYDTDEGDVPELTVTASTDDDSASQTVTVEADDPPEEAFFSVTIDADTSVTAGEDIVVGATIENTGEQSGTQDIIFEVDGETAVTESVSLDGGASTTETFTYTTSEETASELVVSVSSDDDSDSQTVAVDQPATDAFFNITLSVDESVTAGEDITADVTIENTGEESATQDIVFEVDGEAQGTESVTLDGGASTTEQFVYTTSEDDVPEVSVSASSDDHSDAQTVAVEEELDPAFFAVSVTADGLVTESEETTVEAVVENTGDESATQDIVFEVDGETVTTLSVSLDGGESTTETFTFETNEADVPAITVSVSSDDDSDEATVSVEESDVSNGDDTDGDDTDTVDDADDDGPGFGVVAGLIGVLAGALLLARRRTA